jgi:hypothetical protein
MTLFRDVSQLRSGRATSRVSEALSWQTGGDCAGYLGTSSGGYLEHSKNRTDWEHLPHICAELSDHSITGRRDVEHSLVCLHSYDGFTLSHLVSVRHVPLGYLYMSKAFAQIRDEKAQTFR